MPPSRNTNLAENLHTSGAEVLSDAYRLLIDTIRSNPIIVVSFLSYFNDECDAVDFIQVVPLDENLKGYGSFNLTTEEFRLAQKEFPGVDFINKKDIEPTCQRQLKKNGLVFPLAKMAAQMAENSAQKALHERISTLREAIRRCQKELSEIAAATRTDGSKK